MFTIADERCFASQIPLNLSFIAQHLLPFFKVITSTLVVTVFQLPYLLVKENTLFKKYEEINEKF